MPINHRIRLLIAASTILLAAQSAQAQVTNVTNTTSTPIPGAGHDYIKLLSETVNPANGSVSVRIQTPTPPGRRLSLPFSVGYDSSGGHNISSDGSGGLFWDDNWSYPAKAGWSYTIPMLSEVLVQESTTTGHGQCSYYNDFVFQDETGGRHSLYLTAVNVPPPPANNPCLMATPIRPSQKLSGGDDYYQAALASFTSPLAIADADGTVYTFSNWQNGHTGPAAQAGLPSTIEDRNGNIITITDLGAQTGGKFGAISVKDTVGRTLVSTSGFGFNGDTVSVAGLANPYTVTWGTTSQNLAIGASLTLNFQSECHTTLPNITGTPSVISKITLPNNTSYQFSYDSTYGLLDKITYPTGGYVSYTWGLNPLSEFASFETPGGTTLNGCHYHYDTPAVLHRYVSFDGVNIALQQDFTYSINWNGGDSTWLTKTTSVKTTDLVTGAIYTTVYTYAPFVAPRQPNDTNSFQPQIPVEQSIVYKNSAGTTMRTINKTWFDQYELKSQQTVLDNGPLTSQTTYTYGPGAQVTEQDDYDFGSGGPGGLLRKTVTNYQAFNAIPLYPSAASIFDRPCQNIVYNGTGTTRVAETDYLYDGGATVCGTAGTPVVSSVSGLVANTHDETNYGSSSTKPRGNATSVTKQCFQGSVNCTNAVATYAYDETGQALSMTDACGNAACGDVTGTSHTTTYSYADSFTDTTAPGNTNAYLTQITHPTTSGVSHIEKFSYAYSDGQLTVSTDQNNLQTQYLYNDPFRRITETDSPDGGQITAAYNDTALTVTTSKKINSTQSATTVAVSDGMGHVKQTQLTSDPQGTILTDTAYDGLGRVHTISNPHRSASSSTDGTTTYAYDALSRVTSVANPDGSAVTTSYSGNCATITDEASKSRKSCSDGLGRMTSVSEDPTGQNIQTTYSYDALDNLTAVVQNGSRNRTFVYDSSSRLTSATNPESGTITYTYDANGNLSTRKDARNITTTYTYDDLNRLTQKSYSDGTPTATFQFDSGSFPGGAALQNAIGRLTIASTSNTMTAFGYDSLGRIKLRDICTPMNCGTGGWAFTYVYDLAGDLTQFNDGILPCNQLFGQTYDGAGRVTQVTSTWSDPTHPATFFTADAAVGYYPNGGLRKATLGNGLSMTNVYNNRLQPCLIDVNSSSATLQTCTDSTPAGNVLDLAMNYNAGVSDNGNVAGWNATGAQSFTRGYTYDSLNRLSTLADTAIAQPCKGLSWTYDAWGNRTDQTVTAGSCGTFHAAVGTNNQLSGSPYQYDAAGNLLNDGSHSYAYDAENRLTQVDGGATATYVYDAFGRRAKRIVGSNSYEYVYDRDGQLTWELLNGHINRTYIRSNGRLLAEYFEGTTYFAHPDHLGSTRLLTRLDQSVRECDDYFAFGEGNSCGDITGTTLKFTGKERDSESGLDNFGLRYFGSTMGRFMSPDSIANDWELANPQTWNRYAYARNNPLAYVDPDGAAVELIGQTDEDRKKALAAIQATLGNKQAADSLYINEVKDGDNTRYFVGIKGDVGGFENLSSGAKDLGELVGAKQVVEFGLTDKDLPGAGKGQGSYTYAPGEIGNANPRVLVNPSAVASASVFFSDTVFGGSRFGPGKVRDTTTGIAAFHEFGHAWKMWQNINAAGNGVIPGANGIDPRLNTSSEALRWENRMRQQVYGPIGPNNAERKVHD